MNSLATEIDDVVDRDSSRTSFDLASSGDGFVAAFKGRTPTASASKEDEFKTQFLKDLKATFSQRADNGTRGESTGLLLKYSYHDTLKESWGSAISMTGSPWDVLVTQGGNYARTPGDEVKALNIALREGLVDQLPARIHYIGTGVGERTSFTSKDLKLTGALVVKNHEIVKATGLDILDRYSGEFAMEASQQLGCYADGYRRDIFVQNLPRIPMDPNVTPVVGIFGGLLQNMPKSNGKSPDEELVAFYHKLNEVLPGAHVVMSVDATMENISPEDALSAYEYSLEIEMFALNSLAHAKEKGLILNKDYDILQHWKLDEASWEDNSVSLYAKATRTHTLKTIDASYKIAEGDRISISRSRKGPVSDHIRLLQEGGFGKVIAYPQATSKQEGQTTKYILHAAP